jgi:signal transduction histidine kinase
MRVSVKTKQIIAVTAIVFSAVAMMGVFYLLSIANMLVEETRTRADLLANGIFTRSAELAMEGGDLREAIARDAGLRSILQMSGLSRQGLYAAVVDTSGIAIVHSDSSLAGTVIPMHPELTTLVDAGPIQKLRAIFTRGGLTREVRLPLVLGTTEFGTIRVAVSTLLIRDDLETALRPAALTAALLLLGAVVVATLLAQWTLRPLLLVRAGLARLGQGETGVTLALPQEDEFDALGESFNVVSERLTQEANEGRLSRATVSRRLAALGRVSSGIAHEVKNPLNAMRIHLELLRMETVDSPQAQDHARILDQQIRRLDEVVQGFLSFARPDAMAKAPVSLHDLFEEILPVIRAEAGKTGVRVEVDCPADLPPIAGDAVQLQQAFLNLAINACQAMPKGGRLRLIGRRGSGRSLEVLVEDNGTGIAPDHLEKIFNLYFTTKPEGSGVGLALVYRTVHLHDGDIDVQSVPGQGTTFQVTLPTQA